MTASRLERAVVAIRIAAVSVVEFFIPRHGVVFFVVMKSGVVVIADDGRRIVKVRLVGGVPTRLGQRDASIGTSSISTVNFFI